MIERLSALALRKYFMISRFSLSRKGDSEIKVQINKNFTIS